MNYYTKNQTDNLKNEKFAFLIVEENDHVLSITLNRESQKNALHPQMVNEIAFAMSYAHFNHDIWMITIGAKGNVFCSGADLKAMMGMAEPNDSSIPAPQKEVLIGELFNKTNVPTISVITGDVYAGGFFFLAGSSIVVSADNVKFGLPEVKRGIYPFQVMASLMRVMPGRKVLDWCIRGYSLPVAEAHKYGLVTYAENPDKVTERVNTIISELKENSPSAMRMGLEAYDEIQPKGAEHKYLMEMLQKTLMTADGQEGVRAFREKRKPNWTGK